MFALSYSDWPAEIRRITYEKRITSEERKRGCAGASTRVLTGARRTLANFAYQDQSSGPTAVRKGRARILRRAVMHTATIRGVAYRAPPSARGVATRQAAHIRYADALGREASARRPRLRSLALADWQSVASVLLLLLNRLLFLRRVLWLLLAFLRGLMRHRLLLWAPRLRRRHYKPMFLRTFPLASVTLARRPEECMSATATAEMWSRV